MASVYTLSSYSLVTFAATVSTSSGTPSYIWSVAVPSAIKGKTGILQLFFNMYLVSNFLANQTFNYGIYVDGVAVSVGDSATIAYTHTSLSPYAISSGGVIRGTNGFLGNSPIVVPVSFSSGASLIQIGITNSSAAMAAIRSVSPQVGSNVTTATGTIDTSNYVPRNTFTTTGSFSYTVPTTVQGGSVQGVFVYLWGGGGSNVNQVGGQGFGTNTICPGGGGGYVSGFYSCAPGTVLTGVVGQRGTGGSVIVGGGGQGAGGAPSGGFSGIFNGGYAPGNTVAIAGGGGCGNMANSNYNYYTGGGGGYPNGSAAYVLLHNSIMNNDLDAGSNKPSQYCVGGGQTPFYSVPNSSGNIVSMGANPNTTTVFSMNPWPNNWNLVYGGQFIGASSYGTSAGGGWFGGCTGTTYADNPPTGGGGGSSYIGNINGATGGIGLTSGAVTSNGTTATATTASPSTIKPGGITSPYYTGSYGCGDGSEGLVVIVPAIGSSSAQVGVAANFFTV